MNQAIGGPSCQRPQGPCPWLILRAEVLGTQAGSPLNPEPLFLTSTPRARHSGHRYPHFTGGQTEAQKGRITCSRPPSWQGAGLSLGEGRTLRPGLLAVSCFLVLTWPQPLILPEGCRPSCPLPAQTLGSRGRRTTGQPSAGACVARRVWERPRGRASLQLTHGGCVRGQGRVCPHWRGSGSSGSSPPLGGFGVSLPQHWRSTLEPPCVRKQR